MNKRQEAKLGMYNAVVAHAESHPEALRSVPAFARGIITLRLKIEAINTAAGQQEAHTSGVTTEKNDQKEALANQATLVAGIIYAWAVDVKDAVMQNAVDYNSSDLQKYKDVKLATVCKDILQKAIDHKQVLSDFGLTEDEITALQSAITAFEENFSAPRTAKAKRSVLTANIAELFTSVDQLLEASLDKTAPPLAKKYADYYKGYLANRKIVNSRSGKGAAAPVPAGNGGK